MIFLNLCVFLRCFFHIFFWIRSFPENISHARAAAVCVCVCVCEKRGSCCCCCCVVAVVLSNLTIVDAVLRIPFSILHSSLTLRIFAAWFFTVVFWCSAVVACRKCDAYLLEAVASRIDEVAAVSQSLCLFFILSRTTCPHRKRIDRAGYRCR